MMLIFTNELTILSTTAELNEDKILVNQLAGAETANALNFR